MLYRPEQVIYKETKAPEVLPVREPVDLTDQTMQERKTKILRSMEAENLDVLLVYGDREHGANFGYLTGFEPRFEEAAVVLHKDGSTFLMLGNESLHMVNYCRIPATAVHVPFFSLPNQPMNGRNCLRTLFEETGIRAGIQVGIAGWKMFTSSEEDNSQIFDVPYFIVEQVKQIVGETGKVSNRSDLFIAPGYGARTMMNANEIAHFEFGAALASECMLDTLEHIEPGITEMELASHLQKYGQPVTVQTICATGERFTNAVVAPRAKVLKVGDKYSSTIGYRGGLTNRSGYLVSCKEELPEEVQDYLDKVAKPYYAAAATWYESIGIGVTGAELYNSIEQVLPKAEYGWELNPGHLTGSEEWMSSPFYEGSEVVIRSGMMLQMDIIVKVKGYGGANAEDGIAIADETLRKELADHYQEVWERIQKRRTYMQEVLGIQLKPEVLPLSNTEGYLRPYLLNKTSALRIQR